MPTGFRCRRSLAAALLLLASACVDRNPLSPDGTLPAPAPRATIQCQVTVATGTMSCTQQAPATTGGVRANVIGGQEINVKLASSGTSYDGTQIFSSTVTVQNLLQQTMGMDTAGNATGIRVYFQSGPVLTSGSGNVEVANPDGFGTLTTGNQPYFLYNETLQTYEISAGKLWQFNVAPSVETFSFVLVVETQLSDGAESNPGVIWTGAADTAWSNGANWVGGIVPNSTQGAVIPPADSVVRMPRLDTDSVVVATLRVGPGSTLSLEGFTLTSLGSVDAVGAINGGTLRMTGAGSVLQGNVNALVLSGGTTVHGATKATGAVSIQDGALNVNGKPLSISVP